MSKNALPIEMIPQKTWRGKIIFRLVQVSIKISAMRRTSGTEVDKVVNPVIIL